MGEPLHRSSPAELQERLAAERRGKPLLVYRDGAARQQIVVLDPERPRLFIGRQSSCDIALPEDTEVSRVHADVECVGGVWTIVDDGRSRNGSFVNGERLHGRRALQHGDVIKIGRTTLGFFFPASEELHSTQVADGEVGPAVTAAQRRVLVALCRPLADSRRAAPPTNRALADELSVSVETVKSHLQALFEAFGLDGASRVNKRAELARLALERGVVSPHELR